MAGSDVDNGSRWAHITSTSNGFDAEAVEAKPLIIVPCWSEASTHEADLDLSRGETANTG